MARYEDSIDTILKHEGGYVNDPKDPGGATNFGVSLRFLVDAGDIDKDNHLDGDFDGDGDVDVEDIKKMSIEDAKKIYRLHFWNPGHFELITDQAIATKCFDMSVNMGRIQAGKILQRALGACGQPVTVDGKVGLKTLNAVNLVAPDVLLFHLRDQQALFYRNLVTLKPSLAKFLKGWLNRAYA